jgi:hypothetical protein
MSTLLTKEPSAASERASRVAAPLKLLLSAAQEFNVTIEIQKHERIHSSAPYHLSWDRFAGCCINVNGYSPAASWRCVCAPASADSPGELLCEATGQKGDQYATLAHCRFVSPEPTFARPLSPGTVVKRRKRMRKGDDSSDE